MYDIKTILVPYHMNDKLVDQNENRNTYTKIKPTTEVLAMNRKAYVNVQYQDLVYCLKYTVYYFCEQTFLMKFNKEHTCESVIYYHQNNDIIQENCEIEYNANLIPYPTFFDARNYLLLGNFPLPWGYFCKDTEEFPEPIHGSSYVIIRKSDLCECPLTEGSWHIESNIMYCNTESKNELTLYYNVNMAKVLYQFEKKQRTEGLTDLSLFTDPANFDTKEPNLLQLSHMKG